MLPLSVEHRQEFIKTISHMTRKGFAIAKALGYPGNAIDYALEIARPDMKVIDADYITGTVTGHTAATAPKTSELLNK